VPGAGIVPGIGALLGRAVERLDHFDVQGRLELLEKHRQGGAHDAGADEDDIGFRGGAISNHEVSPFRHTRNDVRRAAVLVLRKADGGRTVDLARPTRAGNGGHG